MSRLSIRPRPLDIHKKIPIVKSVKEFEDDEVAIAAASTRNSHLFRQAAENDNEGYQTPSKKNAQEIPTPQYSTVDTYERDYSRTFMPSTSYIRGRGVRSEIGEFVEYDLDNEDDDWLEDFNNGRMTLTPEKFEILLFKLEVLDQKSREKAGLIMPTFGSPVPVILQLEAAAEALKFLSLRLSVLQSVYSYWKAKRERWQKPILRHLQPPPPVNDTNPYNVFRPREKAHRLHTRRMQRRENNAQSFEKLRQVRRSLDQAKRLMEALIKREETKREILECEVNLQRIQTKYKHEALLIEDGMTYPGFEQTSSDEDYVDSDENTNGHLHAGLATHHPKYVNSKFVTVPMVRTKHELKRRPLANGWIQKEDADGPVMLITKPLDLDKLVAAGITPPSAPHVENDSVFPAYRFHGRIGRGGRIIFDRWNPFSQAPIGQGSASYVAPNPAPLPNG